MEVSLVLNRRVHFNPFELDSVSLVDGRIFEIYPLYISPKVSFTKKLIEELESCGVCTASGLEKKKFVDLPEIILGLKKTTEPQLEHEYVLGIEGVSGFLKEMFGEIEGIVNFRVDIGQQLKDHHSGCILEPRFSSQFFTSFNGGDVNYVSQFFSSPKTSTQILEAWNDPLSLWKTSFSCAVTFSHYGTLDVCNDDDDDDEEEDEPEATNTDPLFINRKILENVESQNDVKVVVDNGTEIKFHRCFLAAHSPVFAAMFQTKSEDHTGLVTLPGMTEESARAFRDYLYVWETKPAEENSAVCFEMFEAGHKYEILHLEKKMKDILLEKKKGWFHVETALKLFVFCRDHELKHQDLKARAMEILNRKRNELKELRAYQELFRDNWEAARELGNFLL